MMKVARALVALVVVVGCAGASTVTPADQSDMPASAQKGSLSLQLDAPSEAAVGQSVPLKLTLTNASKDPAQVMLGGRPPFDVIVTSADGAVIWRWSEGQAVQMVLEVRTLKPGEQIVFDAQWPATTSDKTPPSPGRYLVRGVLNMDPPEKLETTPKEIVLASR